MTTTQKVFWEACGASKKTSWAHFTLHVSVCFIPRPLSVATRFSWHHAGPCTSFEICAPCAENHKTASPKSVSWSRAADMVAHGVTALRLLSRSMFCFLPIVDGINFSTCAFKPPTTMDYTRKAWTEMLFSSLMTWTVARGMDICLIALEATCGLKSRPSIN